MSTPSTDSPARLRIAFVAPFGYPVLARDRSVAVVGGAEVQQAFLAREFARRGHEVSMISMDYGQAEGSMVDGVRQIRMHAPQAGLPVLRFIHPRWTSLWAAMRRADADIYYQRASGALTGQVALAARSMRRRVVFASAHDGDFNPCVPLIRLGRDKMLYRWGVRHADRIVVQSPRQQQGCRAWPGREADLVPSCYGHRGEPARHEGDVLWVANVKSIKRPELFVELARRLPQFRFRLVGGGGEADMAQLRSAAEGVGNLVLTGFVPYADVEAQFDGASVFVNTSTHEGFPNTFLQAWSRAMPTVSFFDPGTRFEDRPVGLVAADLDAMVAMVQSLKSDAAHWRDQGALAQRYVQSRHSVENAADIYLRIFQSMAHPARHAT